MAHLVAWNGIQNTSTLPSQRIVCVYVQPTNMSTSAGSRWARDSQEAILRIIQPLSRHRQVDLALSFFVGFYEPGRGLYVDDLRLIAKCRLGVTVGRLEAS